MSSASDFLPSVTRTVKTQVRHVSARFKWIITGVAVLILFILVWHFVSAAFSSHKKPPPPPSVRVATAKRADVSVIEHTIATVVSPATVQVTAQVSGKLLTAYFQEGQIVHKGDPLFQIDPAPFQNVLAQTKAQLAKDEAQALSLSNDEKRYVALYSQNAASQQSRDQAVAAAQGALATVESDRAAVNIAAENLGYAKIVSPVDGKTGPIMIQPGNLITVGGATPLVTITQIQPIKLSFFMPQNELAQIQNELRAGRLTASAPIPGSQSGAEKAEVDFVSNVVNASTGTIELRATFSNADTRLVPGQSVNVSVVINQLQNATVVPRDAVNQGPNSSYIYVIGKNSVIASKPVTVLNDDGIRDAVKGDVKPGDKVVVEGQIRVVAGAKVRVQKGSAAPASSAADSDMPT